MCINDSKNTSALLLQIREFIDVSQAMREILGNFNFQLI